MTADFQNVFTVRLSTKFAKQCSLIVQRTLSVRLHYHVKLLFLK